MLLRRSSEADGEEVERLLEAFPVEARMDALMAHIDNLNRAHESILKAKAQIAKLTPLIADCDQHQ